MSNPQRPPKWEECCPEDFKWIQRASAYMDHLKAENRKLRDRLTEAERLLRCDDIFVSAGQQEAWKAERDAFLNQKED